jgi:hypothetical protein
MISPQGSEAFEKKNESKDLYICNRLVTCVSLKKTCGEHNVIHNRKIRGFIPLCNYLMRVHKAPLPSYTFWGDESFFHQLIKRRAKYPTHSEFWGHWLKLLILPCIIFSQGSFFFRLVYAWPIWIKYVHMHTRTAGAEILIQCFLLRASLATLNGW